MRIEKVRWGVLLRSDNRLDGYREHLDWEYQTGAAKTFLTRREARVYADTKFGYIRKREDLRAEPHGWKPPKVVKVRLISEVIE